MQFKSDKWLEALLDKESFQSFNHVEQKQNLDVASGGEVSIGFGKILGKTVAIYAQNVEINRGYIGQDGGEKILALMEKAAQLKIPVIALLASPGIDMENDLDSGISYTKIISQNIALSGVIPQFAVIMGPTLGAPAYSSVLMDLIFFSQYRSYLMVTSPAVVKQAIGETVSLSDLGGPGIHGQLTGIADFIDKTTALQLERVKALVDFFPSHGKALPEKKPPRLPLKSLPEIPTDLMKPFDMMDLIEGIVDESKIYPYKSDFGLAMICAFTYLDGYPLGLVANQGKRLSGAIDSDAAQKSSQFIRLCDTYNIPILTLIDVPGFMPGKREEQRGLLKHGARFCSAMQTQVPRLSVIVRKAYGAAAFLMMQTRAQGGDLVLALQESKIGAMGQKASAGVRAAEHNTSIQTSEENGLLQAYQKGLIDEIIVREQIRPRLSFYLSKLVNEKQKPRRARKHFIEP